MADDELVLDPDQQAVVRVPADRRQIVLAGPGSGKTQVVAALLEHLTEEEGLSPTDELLVISFSRAAVAAVRQRASRTGGPRVTVRTLDALAARLLDDLEDDENWKVLSFDRRVERAVRLLRAQEWDELQLLGHLVVDEVQDVVGVRAEFLLALIKALPADAGFSLLGDPMQAVYDFQLDERYPMTSAQLLEHVKGQQVVERRLHGQYRAQTSEAEKVLSLGVDLAAMQTAEEQAGLLDDVLADLVDMGSIDTLAKLAPRWGGPTAVLCRTNGEALVAARELRQAGLGVCLQRSAQDPAASPALAKILAEAPGGRMSRAGLLARAEEQHIEDGERLGILLSDLVRGRGADIDVTAVARRLSAGVVPVELQEVTPTTVVVSTVHRAKGLEYDNVVLLGAQDWLAGGERTHDSVRQTFVALTRTRERLVLASPVPTRGMRVDSRTGRWIQGGPKQWMTFGFEMRGADTRWPAPVGDPAPEVQSYLGEDVKPSDPVELQLDPRLSTLELPIYSVVHDARLVGRTTESFGEQMRRRLGPAGKRQKPWPDLSGAVVESIETLGGAQQPLDRCGGVGRWGLWLSIRLTGLLEVGW